MRSTSTPRSNAQENRSIFVKIDSKGGILTVRPAGPALAEREAVVIASEVRPAIASEGRGFRVMVLDLSDVTLMSSFGLGMCIELRNLAESAGASTVMFGMTPELIELFKMLKVDRLYTMATTPKELAKALAA